MTAATLFAQDPAKPAAPGQGPGLFDFGGPGFVFAMLGLAMIFLFVLPARRQRKEQEKMITALKPGTKVVTAGGIIGTIAQVKEGEDEITIKSVDAKFKVLKSSVARVLGTDDAADAK